MKTLAEKISDSELEVMRVLWRAEDALSVTDIRESLQAVTGWEATTIKTLIQRLYKKGVIAQEKRTVYHYRPLLTEADYNAWATGDLVRRLYGDSVKSMVAALVHSDGLTEEDVAELRALFRVEGEK